MVNLEDIVESIVTNLSNEIKVKRVLETFGTTATKVLFCDYKWLSLYQGQGFGQYGISTINEDGSVWITSAANLQVGELIPLPIPPFFSGTPLVTVEEWANFSTNENVKLPFIWLVTPSNYKNQDQKMTVKTKVDIRVFFIHNSDWKQLNRTRVNDSVKPMHAIAAAFVETVNNNKREFDYVKNNTIREFPRFGKETAKGIEQTIFNSTLAAVELRFTLELKNYCKC